MADYSGYIEGDKSEKVRGYSYNQTLYMPVTYADVQRAIKEALEGLKEDTAVPGIEGGESSQGDEVSEEKTQDPRSDFSRGFDAGWSEGYEAAQHEAVVAVVKAITNL